MKALVKLFFAAYLGIGLFIFGDYGIGWDEPMHRQQGRRIYEYVTEGNPRGVQHHMRYHGPLLDTTLYAFEAELGLEDSRAIYLMRHLGYFLVFYSGAFFFYLLAARLFKSRAVGLLGSFFLVLSPRIFADSFYNPKDVPCLALFIISVYALLRFLEEKNLRWAALLAVASACLITIRLVGVLVPFFATVALFCDPDKKSALRSYALYAALTCALTLLLWPTLWRNPPYHLWRAFRSYGQYEGWPGTVLYLGREIPSAEVPWHYTPVWILITTPLSYVLSFFVGCAAMLRSRKRGDAIVGAWFFLPLLAIFVLHSIVYDTWRHTYFVYPAFLLIALKGLERLWRSRRRALQAVVASGLLLDAASTASFMIRNHPHQHLYFNALVGGIAGAKDRFDLDYWGVTYRAALERLLAAHPGRTMRVMVANLPGRYNTALLKAEDRRRFVFVEEPKDAEFYITNFRFDPGTPFPREAFSVLVDGVPVLTAFEAP